MFAFYLQQNTEIFQHSTSTQDYTMLLLISHSLEVSLTAFNQVNELKMEFQAVVDSIQ